MLTKTHKVVSLLSLLLLCTGCGASQPPSNANQALPAAQGQTSTANVNAAPANQNALDINEQLDNRLPEAKQPGLSTPL